MLVPQRVLGNAAGRQLPGGEPTVVRGETGHKALNLARDLPVMGDQDFMDGVAVVTVLSRAATLVKWRWSSLA
jgi:hypothetical protein